MKPWTPSVPLYPHFDAKIPPAEAERIVKDPQLVATHKFFPFLKYDERWTMFAQKGSRGKSKQRPIRFAARLDSCIFSYYRHQLSEPYEQQLKAADLGTSIIAYRRIPKADGKGGQSNIDFALSAFEAVQRLGNCCAVALDISSFFENLDHAQLQSVWAGLIGQTRLPPDHYKVFQAITRYAFADVKKVYERLGYFGDKEDRHGKVRKGYLRSRQQIPTQLCTGKTFREKIAGEGPLASIIEVNKTDKGVPQGAPLSDLLANAYLLKFDKFVQELCTGFGGTYYRYSDDILIVAPISASDALGLEADIRKVISTHGGGLIIKEEKSAVHQFHTDGARQRVTVVKATDKDGKPAWSKPFEYLGFRYDGRSAFIRDKTMSNLHRKIASICRATAIRLTKRYQGKCTDEIMDMADFERLFQSFGSVQDFHEKSDDYRSWTFTTYAKRAAKTMGPLGTPIGAQLKGLRRAIEDRLRKELSRVGA
ncbi:reverse transcriptase domain-containing protein [Rhizobium leguminosarum]|uniref:reverse transcriptase domain-containing protein n=1 Tax=Rhizobium leguminosarum TaxID=384 RepID=UPI001FE1D052|nr:reverse transcriptase domain-containing protein [Rhizobium leguminosarum]